MITSEELSQQFAGKSVLITGAGGFIGSHLCHRLATFGARIHAVSRSPQPRESDHIQWWQADCSDVADTRRVVASVRAQFIFHLASHVTGARNLDVVLPTFYNNLASTVHLLTAAAEIGCRRMILASSSEEPQAFDGGTFACSPYAAAKWAGSIYGRMFHQLFGFPVVMPRIFMTYGPDQKDIQKLVPSVARHLLRGEIPKLSSGQRRADWIYVDDVVEGLLRAAITPGIDGCAFDLGTGVLTSVREIVEQIARNVPTSVTPAFGALPDRPFEQERPADVTFLSTKLGFTPRVKVEQGIASTVSWYQQQVGSLSDPSQPH